MSDVTCQVHACCFLRDTLAYVLAVVQEGQSNQCANGACLSETPTQLTRKCHLGSRRSPFSTGNYVYVVLFFGASACTFPNTFLFAAIYMHEMFFFRLSYGILSLHGSSFRRWAEPSRPPHSSSMTWEEPVSEAADGWFVEKNHRDRMNHHPIMRSFWLKMVGHFFISFLKERCSILVEFSTSMMNCWVNSRFEDGIFSIAPGDVQASHEVTLTGGPYTTMSSAPGDRGKWLNE